MVETDTVPKVPDFFSNDFFKKCLQHGLQTDDIEIEAVKTSLGSAVGENYMSTIYRTQIKYHQSNESSQEISLIVKVLVIIPNKIEELDAFEREVKMYTVILPKIEELFGHAEIFVPKCFYADSSPTYQVIVLQDLKSLNYTLADRVQGLDEAHARTVLKKLGKYHAGTKVLHEKEPEIFKIFDVGFFQATYAGTVHFQGMFLNSLLQFTEFVSKWEGFEKIVDKLKQIANNFEEKCKKHLTLKPGDIKVLNHSDLWTNNMMFKYENGNVCSIKFIDLQVSTNDSLGCDINYFFNTSIEYDLLKRKREELIKCYYESFHEALKELQYSNIPTLEAVQNEVKKREFFGFLAAIGIAPIVTLDREESKDATFEKLVTTNIIESKRAIVFANPRYQDFMKYSLKRLDELGVLEL